MTAPRALPDRLLNDPNTRARYMKRVMSRIEWPADAMGCWIWTGQKHHFGHGNLGWRDQDGLTNYMVHRIMYAWWYGDTDQVLDHLCDNPSCVNPMHLNPCTQAENNARSELSITAINARKTECVHGHPFDEANTIVRVRPSDGRARRVCRECERINNRRMAAKRKAKRHAAKAQRLYSGKNTMGEQIT